MIENPNRLAALRRLVLLDSPPSPGFDRLAPALWGESYPMVRDARIHALVEIGFGFAVANEQDFQRSRHR